MSSRNGCWMLRPEKSSETLSLFRSAAVSQATCPSVDASTAICFAITVFPDPLAPTNAVSACSSAIRFVPFVKARAFLPESL